MQLISLTKELSYCSLVYRFKIGRYIHIGREYMKDLPTLVYCIDEGRTKIAEDGYYITSSEETHKITIVAIAVTEEELDFNALCKTLGKNKDERSRVNKKMFPAKYIFNHNLQHGQEIPAITVDFEIKIGNYNIDDVVLNVSLRDVKKFKQLTYEELSRYGISPHNSSFREDMNIIRKLTTAQNSQLSFGGFQPQTSMSRDFVWKLLRIYNYACTEACRQSEVPYIGRETIDVFEGDFRTLGIFNCPLRHPEAVINNINLAHFLRYESPFFSEEEIKRLLAIARKTPVV